MTDVTLSPDDIEDLGESIRGGRPLRQARAYRIQHANEDLDIRPVLVNDPLPTGRQILQAIGLLPVEEYSLFFILQDGSFEDVSFDQTIDLRERGAERFVHFRSDRDFRFRLDDKQMQ